MGKPNLEDLLGEEEKTQWHVLDYTFNAYLQEHHPHLIRAEGHYAHCNGCAHSINKGKTRYVISGEDDLPRFAVDVPNEYDVGENALMVFAITENNEAHGFIKKLPERDLSKKEREELRQSSSALLELMQQSDPLMHKDIYCEMLIDSDNPRIRELAEKLRQKYAGQLKERCSSTCRITPGNKHQQSA